jgi:hypothetical protein
MSFKVMKAVLTALTLITSATATVSTSGSTLVVNGISYYAAPEVMTIIDATADQLARAATTGVDLIPLTVIADSSSSFTVPVFRSTVDNYTASDDVFNTGFLQGKQPHLLSF